MNIPEDAVRVQGEFLDEEHRNMLHTSSANVPTYGGTQSSLVGNDERNGRINPALEVNDDEIDLTEMKRRKARRVASQANTNFTQSQTSF